MIENGTKINLCSKDLIQPLHLACRGGDLKIVQYLLSKGSEINAQDIDGYSCLHYAAYNKHQDIVKFLIHQGIEINLKDDQVFELNFMIEFFHFRIERLYIVQLNKITIS